MTEVHTSVDIIQNVSVSYGMRSVSTRSFFKGGWEKNEIAVRSFVALFVRF